MAKVHEQLLTPPSGFPDFGPEEAIALSRMLDVIRKHYEQAGFTPIETPLVERTKILTEKSGGEISTQIYGLRLLNAPEGVDDTKDLALRFDQTVPLARFVAGNYGSLPFPFRRYVIGPVFRGERPKDGRYRQFIQADVDVLGDGSLEIIHDAEMVGIINNIFTELNIGPFTVRIGNRKVLQGLLLFAGLTTEESMARASGAIDRLEKIGREHVVALLVEIGIEKEKADALVDFLTETKPTDETLALLQEKKYNDLFTEGVAELLEVVRGVRALGVPETSFCIDSSIARGLEYYTGTVYETRLDNHPTIGSIASGGRYEKLTETFIDKSFPGVGISIGVTRLIVRLMEAGLWPKDKKTVAPVLVTTAAGTKDHIAVYLGQATLLRKAGIGVEVYLANKDLSKQMRFADKKGFSVVLITKEDHIAKGEVTIRNMKTGNEEVVSEDILVEAVKRHLM